MSSATAGINIASYRRTMIVVGLLVLMLIFSFAPLATMQDCVNNGGTNCGISLRALIHSNLLGFFEWMETTWFGVIGKTWGAAFAIVEAFHLVAMALLGGSVFITDARLLGIGFKDYPADQIVDKAHSIFVWALAVVLFTGVFMACGVAVKIYYLPVFWYKMLALLVGMLFVFFIKRPLLKEGLENLNPNVVRLVAVSSTMIWITVAATGRWIGFS